MTLKDWIHHKVETVETSVDKGLQQIDPTNPHSKLGHSLQQIDPTNPHSAVGELLPQIDPTNPHSKLGHSLQQIDPTNPHSAVGELLPQIDPTNPHSGVGEILPQFDPTSPHASLGDLTRFVGDAALSAFGAPPGTFSEISEGIEEANKVSGNDFTLNNILSGHLTAQELLTQIDPTNPHVGLAPLLFGPAATEISIVSSELPGGHHLTGQEILAQFDPTNSNSPFGEALLSSLGADPGTFSEISEGIQDANNSSGNEFILNNILSGHLTAQELLTQIDPTNPHAGLAPPLFGPAATEISIVSSELPGGHHLTGQEILAQFDPTNSNSPFGEATLSAGDALLSSLGADPGTLTQASQNVQDLNAATNNAFTLKDPHHHSTHNQSHSLSTNTPSGHSNIASHNLTSVLHQAHHTNSPLHTSHNETHSIPAQHQLNTAATNNAFTLKDPHHHSTHNQSHSLSTNTPSGHSNIASHNLTSVLHQAHHTNSPLHTSHNETHSIPAQHQLNTAATNNAFTLKDPHHHSTHNQSHSLSTNTPSGHSNIASHNLTSVLHQAHHTNSPLHTSHNETHSIPAQHQLNTAATNNAFTLKDPHHHSTHNQSHSLSTNTPSGHSNIASHNLTSVLHQAHHTNSPLHTSHNETHSIPAQHQLNTAATNNAFTLKDPHHHSTHNQSHSLSTNTPSGHSNIASHNLTSVLHQAHHTNSPLHTSHNETHSIPTQNQLNTAATHNTITLKATYYPSTHNQSHSLSTNAPSGYSNIASHNPTSMLYQAPINSAVYTSHNETYFTPTQHQSATPITYNTYSNHVPDIHASSLPAHQDYRSIPNYNANSSLTTQFSHNTHAENSVNYQTNSTNTHIQHHV